MINIDLLKNWLGISLRKESFRHCEGTSIILRLSYWVSMTHCILFVHFVRMTRLLKGLDEMFLNKQEDQKDLESILTAYKMNTQHTAAKSISFSFLIIAAQHLEALSVSNGHNSSFWIRIQFFLFYYFQFYSYIDHSYWHVSVINGSTKDVSILFVFYFISIRFGSLFLPI